MSESPLHALAREAGVAVHWQDFLDRPQVVGDEVLQALLAALGLPAGSAAEIEESRARLVADRDESRWPPIIVTDVLSPVPLPAIARTVGNLVLELEGGEQQTLRVQHGADGKATLLPVVQPGYHRLLIEDGSRVLLAVAPAHALSIADVAPSQRLYGVAAQLYSLRREDDGGIGDFSALAQFAASAARQGADAVAISPAHALFAADLDRFGPYAPSSRLFLNPLYADPAAALGADAFAAALSATGLAEHYAALEALPLVDWPQAARAKWQLLRALWSSSAKHLELGIDEAARDFRIFRNMAGERLLDHARFEAIHAAQFAADPARWHWRSWPAALRDPRSRSVAEFAAAHADDVEFQIFAQWLADRGLRQAQSAAREAGMRIGLISDLAVGTDGGGSHAWSRQGDFIDHAAVGAPPDMLNAAGQNWGLTSFSPHALKQHCYAPFLEMIRASLRHAGGIRIDHVLGLRRLWLVPDGVGPGKGAYLQFPLDDLLRLVALESSRHRAIVIGEDLGTVPAGFRDRLDAEGVLGMQVLWFERDHRLFVEPRRWSAKAMATTSTHDLATVAGWWAGRDIDWRAKLDLFGEGNEAAERSERDEDRRFLWGALEYAKLVTGAPPAVGTPEPVVDAAIAFVSRTPAPLAMLPVEDLLGLVESPNLPGTTDEHPNWRRRLPGAADVLLDQATARARLGTVRRERGLE
jgi:4-alpha-glucanotransferase